jgi:hypothetical protein
MSRLTAMRANLQVDDDIENIDVDVITPTGSHREQLLQLTGMATANEYQIDVFDHLSQQIDNYQNGTDVSGLLVTAVAGSGKCLGIDTPVLMFDGTIKCVQDVVVGDQLMGPDSLPRDVQSTNIGYGALYKITPVKGDSFVCNDVHVMTLKGTNRKMGQIKDIPLNEHIENTLHLPRIDRDWKLFRVGVEYPAMPVAVDPYLMGAWLGDGTKTEAVITNADPEIIQYCIDVGPRHGCEVVVKRYGDNTASTIRFRMGARGEAGPHTPHLLKRNLLESNIDGQRRIPTAYLINDQWTRLQLLAGLLDTDGYCHKGGYEIITKYEGMADDILYLTRSLGFAAYSTKKTGTIKSTGFSGIYNRITISGSDLSLIPIKVPRKIAQPRKQIKRTDVTGWAIDSIEDGNFYGFTLDGDGRFLLGDFTVTHNTSTIVAAAKLIPSTINTVFLAFNKSIATELSNRLPKHIESSTLNRLGYRQIVPYAKSIGCNVDPYSFSKAYRTSGIIRNLYDWKDREKHEKHVKFLVAKCKSMGVIPVGVKDGWAIDGRESTDDTFHWLLKQFDETIDPIIRPTVFRMAREVLLKSWSESDILDTNCIDFDDQIWLTVCKRPNGHKLAQPIYDCIIIDECQDLNATNLELIRMVLKPNGIVIGVGDKFQSIYQFRGADTRAMEKFTEFFNAISLPLSITYRCSQQVTQHAQELVPTIQYAPKAVVGEAPVRLETYNAATFQAGDMILCRNNAPLLALAYKLLIADVPAMVKGTEIGAKLISLITDCVGVKKWEKVNGRNVPTMSVVGATTAQLNAKLQQWTRTQTDIIKADDPDNEDALQTISDKAESIMVFVNTNVDGKVTTIVNQLESLFGDKETSDMVLLSSIHKAKGLEADRVFMYASEHLYPWWVKKGTDGYQQEQNLDYVARTRAKNFYGYLPTKGWVA